MNTFSIALPGDQMWQRVIAKRVIRKVEMAFIMLNGIEFTGWVTGLDEEWVQITDRDLNMHCLSLANLVVIAETGTKFYELEFTDEQKKKFESFTNRFRQTCEAELKKTGDSAFYRASA